MQVSRHPRPAPMLTQTRAPMPATARRLRASMVRPQAALGPVLTDLAQTAVTTAAITGAFGGLLEVLAPHGQKSAKRVGAAVRFGGAVGGGAALGVAIPQTIAMLSGLPLGVVVGSSLVGIWIALRAFVGPHGGR